MARRGTNLFKRNDGLRALRIARDGGIEPAMIEIVATDGTIFRVYGDNAALTDSTQGGSGAKAWDAEIAKLRAATPKGRGQSSWPRIKNRALLVNRFEFLPKPVAHRVLVNAKELRHVLH